MLSKNSLTRKSHRRGKRNKRKRKPPVDPILKGIKQKSDNIIENMIEADPRNQPYRDSSRQPESAYADRLPGSDEFIDWDDLIGFDPHWD